MLSTSLRFSPLGPFVFTSVPFMATIMVVMVSNSRSTNISEKGIMSHHFWKRSLGFLLTRLAWVIRSSVNQEVIAIRDLCHRGWFV